MTSFGPKRATSRTGLLPNTPWTQLIRSRGGDTVANEALGHVVGLYWRPIHVCMMKRGFSAHDAEDLTQEFLSLIVLKGQFERIDPAKGKLRSYLLTALNHFLANVWRDRKTQRLGSGAAHISLDHEDEKDSPVLPDHQTPDAEFDREWALTVLDNVMKELRADYAQQGKQDLFEALSPALSVADGQTDANAMGEKLGMNAGAVRVALHRLRLRYRNMLYRHIAATVEREDQVEGEIREMIAMLRRR
ncbi:MAG: sigma-70 family RNA polymerase sigma factor [Verrucomicrobiaceae bacterium]|nr:sigma-70 family RNA polymerase sigma factor [Verrucomicrobiaceae bacterium]